VASPVAPNDRIEAVDAVRGVALFGVLIVNLVTEFRVSIFQQFLASTARIDADRLAERIVAVGFESKAFCLFSLLFGVGLAIQFDRLSATGRPLYWLARRLAVLLAFGLAHLLLIWNGDILTEYALAGFIVLPLLLLRRAALLVVAASFLVLYVVGPLVYSVPWPDAATLQAHVASANRVYSSGNLAEVWRFSLGELPLLASLHLWVFPRTLALFVFGAFLWRIGFVKRAARFTHESVIAATGFIAAVAALSVTSLHDLFAPVLLALGYGAALLALAEHPLTRPFLSPFAPVGRMAFTNYLLQSIIFSLIFFGYGLGQFGHMGATAAFVLGVAVYVAQLIFSHWWLRRYRFGPVEWLWRTLMYGVPQPMAVRVKR
jgi:uncharacterized protein